MRKDSALTTDLFGLMTKAIPVVTIEKMEMDSAKRCPVNKLLQEAYDGLFNSTTEEKWAD